MQTSWWTRLFDLISPRQCAICGRRLSVNESVICAPCHLHLPLTGYERSPLDNPMARLYWGRFPVERAAAMFFYESQSAVSQLIYDLKYRGRPEVGQDMGAIMARQFAQADFFSGMQVLVPMPITRRREWQRGYNQSLMIARGVSQVTGLPIESHAVVRTRFSGSQTHRHRWERLNSVEDSFLLRHPEHLAHRHVLLIDDITTTGATVAACAEKMARAPGITISVLTLGITKS